MALAVGSDPIFPHHFTAHSNNWDGRSPGRRGQLTEEEEMLPAHARAQMTLD